MKNTVIFDLDGLLIDSEIISFRLYEELTGKYGRSMTLEEYATDYSGKTGITNMKLLLEKYQLPITFDAGMAFVDEREKEYLKEGVALKPGARELLAYLKENHYKILLATSSTEDRAEGILQQNGIRDYFDHLVYGVNVKRGKPFPDIFMKACEDANEPRKNCLVLEDSEAGIQAAHSAGIDVICIPDMREPGEEFKKMVTAQLISLKDVIIWLQTLQLNGVM